MVAPVTVRTWAQKGLLVAKVTPGGHRRFLKTDVERFMRESRAAQANIESSAAARVLIVDNDPLMITYVHDIFKDSGRSFITEIAQNGFEAGVKIHTFSPDVVLLNCMPLDIDGFRICSLIKGDAATRHIRVIGITADMGAEKVTRILEAGAETFLAKPFNPQDLLEILSRTTSVKKILPSAQTERSSQSEQFVNESDDSERLLLSLTRIAKAKNSYIGHHDATWLATWVDIFGRSLGRLSQEELLALRNACLLHDIGNLGIPDSILLKPAPLTEEEWTIMRSHTLIGAQLCSDLKGMSLTVPIIRSHHERWDGSGYPDGLKGEAIPFLARVFQFVDIFEALSSPRPYKGTFSFEEVISILRQEIAEGWLDPNLGAVFLELLKTRPQDFNVIQVVRDDGEA
jgi:putative two-component system response regulator